MVSWALENFSGRITRNLQLQLLGVVLPGLLIITESALFAMGFSVSLQKNPLELLSSETKDLSLIASALLITLLVALSYIVGRIARRIIFAMAVRLPKPINAAEVYSRLEAIWPPDLVGSVFRDHRAVWAIFERSRTAPDRQGKEESSAITLYCLKWLGQNAADLEFQDDEIEINLLFTSIFPVLLFAPAIMVFDPGRGLLVAAATVSLVTAVFLYMTASQIMRNERAAVLRNFLIAHLVRDRPTSYLGVSSGDSASPVETSKQRGSS
jgi:hypothetical protein